MPERNGISVRFENLRECRSMQDIEYVFKVAKCTATRCEIKDKLTPLIFTSRVTLSSMPLHQGKDT
jgi:hypothetical protein